MTTALTSLTSINMSGDPMDEAENKKQREQVWRHLGQQVAKIPQQKTA